MRKLFVTILLLNIFILSAQTNVDTLCIGKYKFKLKQVKLFYSGYGRTVVLPSEYEEQDKVDTIKYKYKNSWGYDMLQTPTIICSPYMNDTSFGWQNRELNISNLIDTIKLNRWKDETPYIKSNGLKNYLCGAEMYRLRNDTLTKYNIATESYPLELVFAPDSYDGKIIIKEGLFVLTHMYYRKGATTYYLDRTLLIRIE